MWNDLTQIYWRIAAGGMVPAKCYVRGLPADADLRPATPPLKLEIVSHCWNYAHLLAYQLSSLLLHPPKNASVKMTVFTGSEDQDSCNMVAFFQNHAPDSLTFDLNILPKEQLFRRSIGRNQAALATEAHSIWFTDCDVLFGQGCLDGWAAAVSSRSDKLMFPDTEACTALLPDDCDLLQAGRNGPAVLHVDPARFQSRTVSRATGPLQITHGDVARAVGYCRDIAFYQQPAAKWCKAHEDRAFRWLLQTQGVPVPIPNVYRIRHVSKGRYTGNPLSNALRKRIRRLQDAARSP
jgi:hypothetical protein